ncbi:hypothetical protein OF855_24620 [Mycolicibacterium fortuitum]|uniref:hypothetical protein n=1 Tax=Mycolicibacterium fortuitum TaxID=1766 RepID=UPI0022BA391D|nr:hypothetical protein [Mycolicibacterium fortuitum]WAY18425.1 hypothetical protein OF855_24620 [Mycolicibacterium fortuitum]
MTDPAVEAAQRAWRAWDDDVDEKLAIASAREMARPIREKHQEWVRRCYGQSPEVDNLLDELAPLIYPTEEPSR